MKKQDIKGLPTKKRNLSDVAKDLGNAIGQLEKTKPQKQLKPKIYLASPYTIGDVAENVRTQIDMGSVLMDHGFTPHIPLLSHFQHLVIPRPYKDWIANDLEWLPVCDAVLRLPGESKGADIEVARAKELDIPVFYQLFDVINYFEVK